MNHNYSIYRLHKKIDELSKFVDLKKIIEGDKNSPDQIRSYYKINHWAYRHFHCQDGFMHFRISQNGVMTDEDIYHQPDAVYEFIKDGDLVVELGCGQGANLIYLAQSCPKARFMGFDLQPRKKIEIPSNAEILEQDYSRLHQLADESVDVVYGIETLVHCSDKEKVLREIYRVMKPGGVMIVYDYALKDRFETFDSHVQTAISLISKGGASAMIESLEEWNTHFTNSGFSIDKISDYTLNLLPDLKRLERKAGKFTTCPWLLKLEFKLLPTLYTNNIIIGWLAYDSCKTGYGLYKEWILRKP
ncbi:MAG: methyltransferase domain-containing protein [Prevotella sp.]|nr:methyltransferase domain-containing protein [Prevotella sp.]